MAPVGAASMTGSRSAATALPLCRIRSPRSLTTSPRPNARSNARTAPPSWSVTLGGGTVITEAGVHPKVAGLVYVSAFSPDAGEDTAQQYVGFAASPDFVIEPASDGFGFVNLEKFKTGFAADTSDADAAFMRDSQVPINLASFKAKLTQAAWKTRPSWAVIATEDKAIDVPLLRHMAVRIGATVTEVSASHALFLTQPEVISEVIDRAARAGGQSAAQLVK